MNDKVVLFMAASGILVAVLLVWAQLWISSATHKAKSDAVLTTVGIGMAYCYFAIFISMISFGIMAYTYSVTKLSTFFLSYSFIIATFSVIVSLTSVVHKTYVGLPLFSSSLQKQLSGKLRRGLILFVLPLGLLIIWWLVVYIFPVTKMIFEPLIDG